MNVPARWIKKLCARYRNVDLKDSPVRTAIVIAARCPGCPAPLPHPCGDGAIWRTRFGAARPCLLLSWDNRAFIRMSAAAAGASRAAGRAGTVGLWQKPHGRRPSNGPSGGIACWYATCPDRVIPPLACAAAGPVHAAQPPVLTTNVPIILSVSEFTKMLYVPSDSVVRPRWKLPSPFTPVPVPICVTVPSESRTWSRMES